MRISDWSSDVCSSDLFSVGTRQPRVVQLLKILSDLKKEDIDALAFGSVRGASLDLISDLTFEVCNSSSGLQGRRRRRDAFVAPGDRLLACVNRCLDFACDRFSFTRSQLDMTRIGRIPDPQSKPFGQPAVRLGFDPG